MSSEVGRSFQAHVHQIEQTPSGVLFVWLKPDDGFDHIHRAGQYLSLTMNGEPSFFSIASMPVANSLIELHIQALDEAKTEFLLNAFTNKTQVTIGYPYGIVDWPADKPEGIFICRNTGFAPVKALIDTALSRNTDRPVHLYWEGDFIKDLYFEKWLSTALKDHPHFQAHLFFALEDTIDTSSFAIQNSQCQVKIGSLHQVIEQGTMDLNSKASWYYLCGSPQRVYHWVDCLEAKGLSIDAMASDVFEYAPRG